MDTNLTFRLGRRFNGLHDYLFRLHEDSKELGAFALTHQQFNLASQGEEVTAECRFYEDALDAPTRQARLILKESEEGRTMLLHLTRELYTISFSEAQLENLKHKYGTESVLVKKTDITGEAAAR